MRRVISAEGRSRAFINAVPVTLNYLKDVGDALVEIQGQNEHQRLADRNVQRALLDDYANQGAQSAKVKALHQAWKTTEHRIHELQQRVTTQDDRKELLSYQLQEFHTANLQANELEQLEKEQKRLAQAQQILHTLNQAEVELEALDTLRSTVRSVDEIDDEHLGLWQAAARATTAAAPQAALLWEWLKRSTPAKRARKHRVQPEQLIEHATTLEAELAAMTTDSSDLDELLAVQEKQHQEFLREAQKLSKARHKHSKRFCQAVEKYMHALGIGHGALSLVFLEHEGEQGLEHVELHVTTNEKFAPGPLNRIASGGEQTRISLAIQIVAAANSALPCLVLDEADVGVGGTTADTVGRILRELAEHTQVICVTHAPQVAALGQNHMRVSKNDDQTDIQPLNHDERIEELARMLAGADVNSKARNYAQELLSQAVSAPTT